MKCKHVACYQCEDDCDQDGQVCATPPGCSRHWADRCRELVDERDEARAEVARKELELWNWEQSATWRKRERDEARAALALLFAEATDHERCAPDKDTGCRRHHLSEPCRKAVAEALRKEARDELDRDALIGAGCSPEQNALALLDLYAERTRDAEAARDEANANYCFMVQRAADEKLDGYRELGARAAAAENERDSLRRLLQEAHSELATIEAITVSPSDTDGLIELCNRMYEAIK
jgi:hypothetical protein